MKAWKVRRHQGFMAGMSVRPIATPHWIARASSVPESGARLRQSNGYVEVSLLAFRLSRSGLRALASSGFTKAGALCDVNQWPRRCAVFQAKQAA